MNMNNVLWYIIVLFATLIACSSSVISTIRIKRRLPKIDTIGLNQREQMIVMGSSHFNRQRMGALIVLLFGVLSLALLLTPGVFFWQRQIQQNSNLLLLAALMAFLPFVIALGLYRTSELAKVIWKLKKHIDETKARF